ncbi:MAG: 3-phosphoshikimate 1-carboxyvinyltransferase [Acidobacteriota bacterium]
MRISLAVSIVGSVRLPGDKSISHRAAIFAAIADGTTRIDNFATSADCSSTLECLKALGVNMRREGDAVIVDGVGKAGLRQPTGPLDCGNSGTTMRLMAGVLAGQPFDSTMTGDDSLRKRPMKRVIAPLTQMGAIVESSDGTAPLVIGGGRQLTGIEYQPPVASAQVKSCVLLAGLFADGKTSVVETTPTRDHTERLLRWFGVNVDTEIRPAGAVHSVSGTSNLQARDLTVPGDISSAAFFLVAAACLPGSDITMPNVGTNPTRSAILSVLERVGARLSPISEAVSIGEPAEAIHIQGGLAPQDKTVILDGPIIANLIDEIPILAILGTQLDHGLEIRDAAELRVKESDRISAVVENLKRMGASVTEFPDGFKVERSTLHGAAIDSFGDHRIAMAFGVAGLLADGETEIIGAECADVSFPGFFETLARGVK